MQEENWQTLIDRYSPMLLCLAFGVLHNREDAKDVCQEVFIEMLKTMPRNREGWLYRTVIYRAINLRKQIDARKRRESKTTLRVISNDPVGLLDQAEQLKIVQAEIAALPTKQREIFLLRHQGEMAIKEIARILWVSEGTVKKQLSRALERLRKKLSGKGENGG